MLEIQLVALEQFYIRNIKTLSLNLEFISKFLLHYYESKCIINNNRKFILQITPFNFIIDDKPPHN